MSNLTLGSLFDGSGGFPLAGIMAGITPVWASEIEPFPIRVTTKRIPQMKHYGDVSKINGANLNRLIMLKITQIPSMIIVYYTYLIYCGSYGNMSVT